MGKKKGFWNKENKKKILVSVFLIVFAFSGSYLIYFILQVSLDTPTPMVVVISRSMEPNINVGDLLFLHGVEDPSQIKVGDVIVYDARGLWSGAPSDPIVHRVIEKKFENQSWWFLTKGDNNHYPDPAWVPQENVIGIVVGRIPYVGYVKIFLTDTGLLVPLLVILSILLIISIAWDFIKKDQEEGEEKKEKQKKLPKTKMGKEFTSPETAPEKEKVEPDGAESEEEGDEYLDTLDEMDDSSDDFDF